MHSTSNLDDGYMGSGRYLRRSIRKYGILNFNKEILEFFGTRELLIEAEKQVITPEMITDINCMNLMGGGSGGFISVEQQKHRSECAGKAHGERIKNDLEYRIRFLERITKIMLDNIKYGKMLKSKRFTNKKHSEKSKQSIGLANSIKQKGNLNSQYGTCWITNDNENKKIKKEDFDKWIGEGWIKGRK